MAALDVGLDVFLAGQWVNAKSFLRNTSAVTITRGRQDIKSSVSPSQATFDLNNRDNRWTIRNPAGTWYQQLGQSTPARFSVPSSLTGIPCYLRMETDDLSFASTPDSTGLQITTGTLSVRCDCKPTDGFAHAFAGKWGATGKSWVFAQEANGNLVLFHWDGSTQWQEDSSVPMPWFGQRIAVRADYAIAAQTITYYTAPTMAGPWTQLGAVLTTGATSLSAAAGQQVQVGAVNATGIYGDVYEAQVYGPGGATAARGNYSNLASNATTLTLTWAANPTAGQKVLVGIMCGSASSVTSVTDNGTSPSTFVQDGTATSSDGHQVFIYRADNISLPASGQYTVTVAMAGSSNNVAGGGAYSGISPGPPTVAPNHGAATSTSVATGTVTPLKAGALYFALFGDSSLLNPETITLTGSGFTQQFVQTNGSVVVPGAIADKIDAGGPTATQCTWTLGDSVAWVGLIAAYDAISLAADPVFTAQTPGATSFTDAQSNTWTLGGTAELSGRAYRFHGELAALPKGANARQNERFVKAQAGGILRRLSQQQAPVDSAMKRAYKRLSPSLNLAAYWPAEDLAGSTQIGQSVGKFAMTSAGLTMGSSSVFACSAPLPVMNNAAATALVDPGSVTWTDNVVRCLLAVPSGGETSGTNLIRFTCANSPVGAVVIQYQNSFGGTAQAFVYSPAGTLLSSTAVINSFSLNGALTRLSAALVQNGANIDLIVGVVYVGSATGLFVTLASVAAGTNGQVTGVSFGGPGLASTAMGHFSVQGVNDSIFGLAQPLNAWNGEAAASRYARLAGEEGFACRIIGPPLKSQPMGNQTQQTITSLLQECETTDQGLQSEPRQVLGLGYVTNWALCSQPPVATASLPAEIDPSLTASSDDTRVVNDVTMTTPGGSTARQVLTAGAMSVQPPGSGWTAVSGSAAAPAAGTVLTQTTPVIAGTYTVNWEVILAGAVGAGDANNFQLVLVSGGTTTVLATSVNSALTRTFPQAPVQVNVPAAGGTLAIKNVGAGTAGTTYTAIIPAVLPGVGKFDTSVQVNPQYDAALTRLAGWYLAVAAADDDRYPAITFHLIKAGVPQALTLADIGSYLQITGSSAWMPPAPVKQIVVGLTEKLGPQPDWQTAFNGIPELPFEVAAAGDPVLGHCDTAGSIIHANATNGAGTFTVDTLTGPLWTTNPADYPFDLISDGMTVTVSGCSGATNPQTFTVSAWSVNGVQGNLVAGHDIRLAHPMILAL